MDRGKILSPSDSEYPRHLKELLGNGPLYVQGNAGLLDSRAIGICGSRDASPNALRYAYEVGEEAAKCGVVVVSGYARGVDRQAHVGTLEAGGGTIAVLAEGIDQFSLVKEIRHLADLGRNFLAISMFEPSAPWTVWRAMERNKLIVGLSLGLFVIEARERGGTIHAAYECKRQGKPLWAIAYSKDLPGREGNRKLLATSAIPLRHTGDLKRALEDAMDRPPAEVKQLVLTLVGGRDA